MSRKEFNIEKSPPSQAQIDNWHAKAKIGRAMFGGYLGGFVVIGLVAFLGYQMGAGEHALIIGAFIAIMFAMAGFFHLMYRLQACQWLEPVSTFELEQMAEFFKSENLAPAVTRYRQEVILQKREFCSEEFLDLKAYNREWAERCRVRSLKSEVYSAGDSQAST